MNQQDQNYKLCLTTVDNKSAAHQLSKVLLQQKLVACVNISSKMTSLYHWQENIVETSEFLLMMKTSSSKIKELEKALLQQHPYDVPEFIIIDIEDGSSDYFNWINSALS